MLYDVLLNLVLVWQGLNNPYTEVEAVYSEDMGGDRFQEKTLASYQIW